MSQAATQRLIDEVLQDPEVVFVDDGMAARVHARRKGAPVPAYPTRELHGPTGGDDAAAATPSESTAVAAPAPERSLSSPGVALSMARPRLPLGLTRTTSAVEAEPAPMPSPQQRRGRRQRNMMHQRRDGKQVPAEPPAIGGPNVVQQPTPDDNGPSMAPLPPDDAADAATRLSWGEEVLRDIATRSNPRVRALVDTGAWVTGMTNEAAAR